MKIFVFAGFLLLATVFGQTADLSNAQTVTNVASSTTAVPITQVKYSPDGNTMVSSYGSTLVVYSRNPSTGTF